MQEVRDPSTGHFINSEPFLQPLPIAIVTHCFWHWFLWRIGTTLCCVLLVTNIKLTKTWVFWYFFVGEHKHCSLEWRQGKTNLPPAPALRIGELNPNNTPTMPKRNVIHWDPFWGSSQSLQALGNIPGASSHCLPLLLWSYPNFKMEHLPVYLPWTPACYSHLFPHISWHFSFLAVGPMCWTRALQTESLRVS